MKKCLNCGENLKDAYCHVCGQKSTTARYTFNTFINDTWNSFINFDSNLWRTFGALMSQPGRFIRNYLLGKRAAFTSPVKYFFTILALNFMLIILLGKPAISPVEIEGASQLVNHSINLLISMVFILLMVPFATGLKLSQKNSYFSVLEYYLFLLYISSHTILIFIVLQLFLRGFSMVLRGPTEGLVWLGLFSVWYVWAYFPFSGHSRLKSILSILISYLFTAIVITGLGTIFKLIYLGVAK